MRALTLIIPSIWLISGCNIFFTSDSGLPIEISGMVYDKDSGSPLPQAAIELWGVDFWGDDELIVRTFSSGSIGQTSGAGFYMVDTSTKAYHRCDSTGIRLKAWHSVHYAEVDSFVSYRLPERLIPINCNSNFKHIQRTINLGLERE
ncbi:hypothetical protein ACG2F4_12050 [Halalkalibaculum sp. DA3122]|uniref:hypothetical protein n=1 Tax=Halalkalibaculum sp. DA3122 TaxID=3373607 RepID=UPI0037549753